jgi:hypothetical protein
MEHGLMLIVRGIIQGDAVPRSFIPKLVDSPVCLCEIVETNKSVEWKPADR